MIAGTVLTSPMKRLYLALLFIATPLFAQTPTPTVTPTRTPTRTPTPTPTPLPPSRYSLATQVRPGFGSFVTEPTLNKLGDTYYGLDWRTFGRVAGNTTTTQKFWCQAGTGSVSAAPSWCQLTVGGNVVGASGVTFANKFIVQGTTDTGLTNAQFLGALGTGIVKSTTTTGVLSIAAYTDFPLFVGTTPGLVPDASGAGAGTYLDKSGNFSQPSGSFTSPLTTKGDIVCYSTGDTRCGVGGHDGYMLTEDSSVATGLSYKPYSPIGKGIFSWNSVTASRVSGTVYQNTASYAMLVIVSCSSTGAGNCELLSDSATPPTVSRSKTSNQSAYGLFVVAWVMPSHYYKVVATTATISCWTEYTLTKGTMTDSGDLSGSRALGTVYQNTSGGVMFVGIEVGTSGSVSVLTDSATPPTTQTARFAINSGVGITMFFPVLNNDYYKVVQGGAATVVKWYEWTLDSSITVTRSPDLATLLTPPATTATTRTNLSGKSLFVTYSGHSVSAGHVIFYAEPTAGFTSVNIPVTTVNTYSAAGGATAYKMTFGIVNPMENYVIISVASTATNDAFFEYTLE